MQARPGRAEPNARLNKNKSCDALEHDSWLLKQKQQPHNGVFRIKTLHWRSLVSSTAAPQTCRRSPSPSRTQHSLPSKVKQINPHLLTYPQPFPSAKTTQSPTELPKHIEILKYNHSNLRFAQMHFILIFIRRALLPKHVCART